MTSDSDAHLRDRLALALRAAKQLYDDGLVDAVEFKDLKAHELAQYKEHLAAITSAASLSRAINASAAPAPSSGEPSPSVSPSTSPPPNKPLSRLAHAPYTPKHQVRRSVAALHPTASATLSDSTATRLDAARPDPTNSHATSALYTATTPGSSAPNTPVRPSSVPRTTLQQRRIAHTLAHHHRLNAHAATPVSPARPPLSPTANPAHDDAFLFDVNTFRRLTTPPIFRRRAARKRRIRVPSAELAALTAGGDHDPRLTASNPVTPIRPTPH